MGNDEKSCTTLVFVYHDDEGINVYKRGVMRTGTLCFVLRGIYKRKSHEIRDQSIIDFFLMLQCYNLSICFSSYCFSLLFSRLLNSRSTFLNDIQGTSTMSLGPFRQHDVSSLGPPADQHPISHAHPTWPITHPVVETQKVIHGRKK